MAIADTESETRRSPGSKPGRCLILANPQAGGWNALTASSGDTYASSSFNPVLETVKQAVDRIGLEAEVCEIASPDRLPERIRAAQEEGIDTIVAAGGDGTIRTVAQSLVGSPLRLGVIPIGTHNNFARCLGLPHDLLAALEVIASGEERSIEVGRIGDEYFLEAAGVGLFADAIEAFGAKEPRRNEIWRVLKALLPIWWNLRSDRLMLRLDGVTHEEEAIMVSVSNTAYLGAAMPIAPDARMDDGLLDVVIVGAMSRWELLTFPFALFSKKHLAWSNVHHARVRTIDIRRKRRARKPLLVHADDHIVSATPVHIEVVPNALRVLVPAMAPG